jgi:hypothetical protein
MLLFYVTNCLSNTVYVFNLDAESVINLLLFLLCGFICLFLSVCPHVIFVVLTLCLFYS